MPIYEYICDDCKSQFEKIVINRQQEPRPGRACRQTNTKV